VLGTTRPEQGSFYGLPWLAGLAGLGHVGGPTVSQGLRHQCARNPGRRAGSGCGHGRLCAVGYL
jgi:hypothetical protein